jgi:hypothetical protein
MVVHVKDLPEPPAPLRFLELATRPLEANPELRQVAWADLARRIEASPLTTMTCRSPLMVYVVAVMVAWGLARQSLLALEPYQPRERAVFEEPWRWHRIPELDGANVQAMAEDTLGNMWFAIGSGRVLRYDGLKWTNTNSISEYGIDPRIFELFGSRDGRVYLLSHDRIDCWNGEWKLLWQNQSGVPLRISHMEEFPDGRLLVQCANGLLVMEGERMEKRTFYTSRRFIADHGEHFRGELGFKILPFGDATNGIPEIRQLEMDPLGGIVIAMIPNLVAAIPAKGELDAKNDWKVFTNPTGRWLGHVTLHTKGEGGVWVGSLEPGWLAFLDLQQGNWKEASQPGLHPAGIAGDSAGWTAWMMVGGAAMIPHQRAALGPLKKYSWGRVTSSGTQWQADLSGVWMLAIGYGNPIRVSITKGKVSMAVNGFWVRTAR